MSRSCSSRIPCCRKGSVRRASGIWHDLHKTIFVQLVDGFARLFKRDRPVGGVQVVNVDFMGPKIGDRLKRCSAQILRTMSFRRIRRGPVSSDQPLDENRRGIAYFVSTTASLRFNLPSHLRDRKQVCARYQNHIRLTSSAVPLE